MKISIAHATRRPGKALEIRKVWLDAAEDPARVEWIYGIDEDDPESLRLLASEPHTVSQAGGGCCLASNDAAKKTTGEIIVIACDDFYPPKHWDTLIADRFNGSHKLPRALLTSDGYRKDRLATLTIITRAWYEKHGYVYPPQFKSMGSDVWITERASRDGCLIDASDITFEHRHPFYKKAEMDGVYQTQNAPERQREAARICSELLEPLPISLCMIVGNEEGIIGRCLDAAKPAFDELCIVRAVGSKAPDSTIPLAYAWCARNGKAFNLAEYRNTSALPHVDNFSAARNLSFGLAKGYWCLWLDADDVLDPDNCTRIREASMNTRFEGQQYFYRMPHGGGFFRERLVKRGKGQWSGAIHELCKVSGDVCQVPEIEIAHRPQQSTEHNHAERNLAILSQLAPDMPRYWFYHHEELFRLGKKKEAIETGVSALQVIPESMQAERYEVCLNLADLQPDKTEHWCFEAIKIDPLRREALAQLTQRALHLGDAVTALQYFKWFNSVPEPKDRPWTHRPIWYGWAAKYLRVLVLRAVNQVEQAAKEHAENMKEPDYAKGAAEYEPTR